MRNLARLLLALSIALTPMLPAFGYARMSMDAQGAAANHADHAVIHIAVKADATSAASTPVKHVHCNGHCCIACGMSFVAANVLWNGAEYGRPIQIPIIASFHPRPLVTTPHRPPRLLS